MAATLKGIMKKFNGVDWDTFYPKTSADQVIDDATHRFVTDTEKTGYEEGHAHSSVAHAPSTAQKNSDITKAEIEAKLTGELTSHTHAGGADITGLARITVNAVAPTTPSAGHFWYKIV